MTGSSYSELLRLTAPEIVLALTGLLVLVLDLSFLRRRALALRFRSAAWVAVAGCVAAFVTLEKLPGQGSLPNGILVVNPLTQLVQIALLALAVLVLLLAVSARFTTHVGEYCALILFATTAMMLLVSTQNLLVIFLTIEFLSLSLYTLTGFDKGSAQSADAALKYFLFGGMSAGILLFGMSLLYGVSGAIALEADCRRRKPGSRRSAVDPGHRHAAHRIWIQGGGSSLSHVGSGGLSGSAHHQRRPGRLQLQGGELLRSGRGLLSRADGSRRRPDPRLDAGHRRSLRRIHALGQPRRHCAEQR